MKKVHYYALTEKGKLDVGRVPVCEFYSREEKYEVSDYDDVVLKVFEKIAQKENATHSRSQNNKHRKAVPKYRICKKESIKKVNSTSEDEYAYEYDRSLYSMKPILKSSEVDDSRPTSIMVHTKSPTLISVLSGKINTVYDLDEYLN